MTHNKQADTMLTTSEIARLLNVHPNTLRRWSNQGILKAHRIGPRGKRGFRREDIAIFLSERAFHRYLLRKAI